MSFLFVDKILTLEEGRFIRGVKQVTSSDLYLCPSVMGKPRPVLMSSVIGETLGQLGAWCAMHACGFALRPVAGVISEVLIHDEVMVGETLLLETTIESLDDVAIEYHSIATVHGRPIFTIVHALGPMLPMDDFICPKEVEQQFSKILRLDENWQAYCATEILSIVSDRFESPKCISFDAILKHQKGEMLTAQKQLSLSAPYLSDHFPLKPVLPLSLLLQAKLELSALLLNELPYKNFHPTSIRRVKMSDFIEPGDIVTTDVQIREKADDRVVLRYQTEKRGKRICTLDAIFEP